MAYAKQVQPFSERLECLILNVLDEFIKSNLQVLDICW